MSVFNRSRKRLLIVALCLALLVMALGVMTASAATITITPANAQGWAANSNSGGGSSVITANAPRSGYGSVEMRGDRTRWQLGTTFCSSISCPSLGLLDDVTDLAFDWMVATDSTSNLGANYTPALRLLIRNGTTNVELAWEGANQSTVVTKGAWVTTDGTAASQKFWRYQSGGTASSPPYRTLSDWQNDDTAFLPTAYVYGISVGVGSSVGGGYHAFADNIVLGFNNAPNTYNFEPNPAGILTFSSTKPLVCGGPTEMLINLDKVANLHGYQFEVSYDKDMVSATGSFVNSWFDTSTNALVVPTWNGACSDGTCRFAVSRQNPAGPLSTTTAQPVAKITFQPLGPGSFSATANNVILSDIDGFAIAPVDLNGATFDFDVCGQASVSGKVSLQGRATPMDGGFIKLIDTSNTFPAIDATFDAAGNYYVANIPVMDGGTPYVIQAAHYLYLGNQKALPLNPGDALTGQNTRLLGGDANNSGVFDNPGNLVGVDVAIGVTIADVGCIGSDFSNTPNQCGTAADPYFATSSSDINKDGTVNIQDLSIAGGNFEKKPFQNW